jgi:hypothetical protein
LPVDKTTDMLQVTNKVYHIRLNQVHLATGGNQSNNFGR